MSAQRMLAMVFAGCLSACSGRSTPDAESSSTASPSDAEHSDSDADLIARQDAGAEVGPIASGPDAPIRGMADAAVPADAAIPSDAAVPADAAIPSDAAQAPSDIELSLLSYNVQARPLLDDARASVNLPLIGKLLGSYDVIGVEECFSQCDKLLSASPHPYRYYFDSREQWWSLTNSGLAGVSRYEPKEVVTLHYQHQAEIADTVASKGVAMMRLLIGGFAIDVYNTHMQAGDSDGAHQAQAAQGEELAAFIAKHSPPEHSVILHGDFNMGPERPGKAFEAFDPNHYSNDADMKTRTATFTRLQKAAALRDVSDELFGPSRDHIDRVLFRAARNVSMTPLSWSDEAARFVDGQSMPLSDSMPLLVRFLFARTPAFKDR